MEQVLIIGSGPAGLTAAIYAARAQLQPLVVEGLQPGGQLTTTTIIENWPGYAEGIDGPELMQTMRRQAERFGTRFESGMVTGISPAEPELQVTIDARTITARCVIIATGATPRLLGLDAEQKLMGRGVSVCATCDGFFFRGKTVLVVGGGDSAIEEALYLSGLASRVTVIHRRNELRASKIMQQQAFDNPSIDFIWDSVVTAIHDVDTQTVTGVTLRNVHTGQTREVACDGLFLALGHVPNTSMVPDAIQRNAEGFIITGPGTATAVPGIFAAGDVTDPLYQQAVTAAAMGCQAALDAERYLREQGA